MAATEEPLVATTEQEEAAAATEPLEEAPAETPALTTAVAGGKKKAKKEGAVKKSRNPPTHPPCIQMITEAITTLKKGSGSSKPAIQKFIEAKYKNLPPNFRKLLLQNLNKLVASGRLVQVKASYKLPSPVKKSVAKPKKAVKKTDSAKPKAKSVAAATSSPNQGSGDLDDSDGSDFLEMGHEHNAKSKDNGPDYNYSDIDDDFHSDLELLKLLLERPRAVHRRNRREAYQISVDCGESSDGYREKSLCLKLLKEIGCEDCFLCCSVDLPTVFFASLNRNEASRLKDVKGVRYAEPCRTCIFSI